MTQEERDEVGELQKLFIVIVLHEVDSGEKTREWFEGAVPSGGIDGEAVKEATEALLERGLVEKAEGHREGKSRPYRFTKRGRAFYQQVLATIADERGYIDWRRVGEIRFRTGLPSDEKTRPRPGRVSLRRSRRLSDRY